MTGETDRRIEVAEEQGVYNGYMAAAAETGVWPDQTAEEHPEPPAAGPHRVSRRGGRSYPEEGRDPVTDQRYAPSTPEEIAEQQTVMQGPGHIAAREVAHGAANNAATKRAAGNLTLLAALERGREARRARSPYLQ